MIKATEAIATTANQTVWPILGARDGVELLRIGCTGQCLTSKREGACDPADPALGFTRGTLFGADTLARAAHLAHDPAGAEMTGIEPVPSQPTLSRFFARCGRVACEAISGVPAWSLRVPPEKAESCTLGLDSSTEAACHLAICACNLCVQRRLGQAQRAGLTTRRWRLLSCVNRAARTTAMQLPPSGSTGRIEEHDDEFSPAKAMNWPYIYRALLLAGD